MFLLSTTPEATFILREESASGSGMVRGMWLAALQPCIEEGGVYEGWNALS